MDAADFAKYDSFVEFQLWPRTASLDARRWINNFRPDERPLAKRLLEGCCRISQEVSKEMFISAFLGLSERVVYTKNNLLVARKEWRDFCDRVIIVRVEGEFQSEASSGYMFTRMARDVLGIEESRIMSPSAALKHILLGGNSDVVFVDDFVGSGDQFLATWNRVIDLGVEYSFRTVLGRGSYPGRIFYVNMICTDFGATVIKRAAPAVEIASAHRVDSRYSALSPVSFIWREDMATEGPAFVEQKSRELGIPDLEGLAGCWRGYCQLGLAIGFDHGTPDSTLPLLTHRDSEWHPLIGTR